MRHCYGRIAVGYVNQRLVQKDKTVIAPLLQSHDQSWLPQFKEVTKTGEEKEQTGKIAERMKHISSYKETTFPNTYPWIQNVLLGSEPFSEIGVYEM